MIQKFIDDSAKKALYDNNWPVRRRWLRIGVLWLAFNAQATLINVLLFNGKELAMQIFLALLSAIMSIFMIYVFGAVWDDNNKRSNLTAIAISDQSPVDETENGETGESEESEKRK